MVKTTGELEAGERERIHGYFAKHVAQWDRQFSRLHPIEILSWRSPDSGFYAMKYIAIGGRLIVTGDVGDAIYYAGADSLAWWSRCDIDYFAGKCVASEYGRGYQSWNDDVAHHRVWEWLGEEGRESRRQAWEKGYGKYALASRQEWLSWLGTDSALDVFGDDYYERGGIGLVVDGRCHAHLIGLKLAVKQLHQESSLLTAKREGDGE